MPQHAIQYATRSLSELKNDAARISKNMAPLVGCKVGESTWAPFTAVNACKALSVVGLECSNVASELEGDVDLTYKFTSGLTTAATDFWRKALEFSPEVLSSSYIMYIASIIPPGSEISAKLKLTSDYCIYTDSTIFDAAYKNERIRLTSVFPRVCHILLSCFTLRYFLNEYSKSETARLNTMEVNDLIITRTLNNIDFVKYVLGQIHDVEIEYKWSVSYARQHLTTLKKNLMMIHPNLLQYING